MTVSQKRHGYWAFVPAGLLAAMLAGLGTMAAIATDDPGFAIEKDYYQKAVAWDAEAAQQAHNLRLDRKLALETRVFSGRTSLRVLVSDASGKPLHGARVELEAFANARSGDRQRVTLVAAAPGAYAGELAVARAGLWELRFTVVHDGERSTHVLRADLEPGPNAS